MRLLISAEGSHEPDWHYVVLDGHGLLVDLDGAHHSCVDPSSLTDPTIARVEWGPTIDGREGGVITRVDGTQQRFSDRNLLTPYIAMFERWKAKLQKEQAEHDASARLLKSPQRIRLATPPSPSPSSSVEIR